MSLSDLVSYVVIAASIFVIGLCLIKSRLYSDGTRFMFLASALVVAGFAACYALVVAGYINIQSLIDFPVLRLLVLSAVILIGAFVIAYDHPTYRQ